MLGWVKATAVARIVHGDGHWRCAQCHVRTARCYLDLQGRQSEKLLSITMTCYNRSC